VALPQLRRFIGPLPTRRKRAGAAARVDGKATQAEIGGGTGRSFRHGTAWCWALQPVMPVTGEVHDVVLVDGVWIGSW